MLVGVVVLAGYNSLYYSGTCVLGIVPLYTVLVSIGNYLIVFLVLHAFLTVALERRLNLQITFENCSKIACHHD